MWPNYEPRHEKTCLMPCGCAGWSESSLFAIYYEKDYKTHRLCVWIVKTDQTAWLYSSLFAQVIRQIISRRAHTIFILPSAENDWYTISSSSSFNENCIYVAAYACISTLTKILQQMPISYIICTLIFILHSQAASKVQVIPEKSANSR